jgi:hypothetical protein
MLKGIVGVKPICLAFVASIPALIICPGKNMRVTQSDPIDLVVVLDSGHHAYKLWQMKRGLLKLLPTKWTV